jgi:hypothetical protein
MNHENPEIENILMRHLSLVSKELNTLSQSVGLNPKIESGSWTNPNITKAYISYFPNGDPAEESIDISIDLVRQDKNVFFVCDICYSSGEMLSEIVNQEIKTYPRETFNDRIDNLCQKAVQELSVRLMDII